MTDIDKLVALLRDGMDLTLYEDNIIFRLEPFPELADALARLQAEKVALAAWCCIHADGKTGIVNDEHGNQQCAKDNENARLQAENEKLREVLEALLCEAENIFECMNDLAGVNWHNYPEPLIRARAALATDEPRHD